MPGNIVFVLKKGNDNWATVMFNGQVFRGAGVFLGAGHPGSKGRGSLGSSTRCLVCRPAPSSVPRCLPCPWALRCGY